ncbi:Hypothetical protein BSM4216_0431 [Bacillus smithii]|nr:Hypothetical protein BSM4216_0431 [Bacillus smithii]
MTLKEKRIEWKARYDAWKESGQSIAEWLPGSRNQNSPNVLLGEAVLPRWQLH